MDKWRPCLSWFGFITLIFLLVPLLAACGSSPSTSVGSLVSTTDNEFTPGELHIQPGQSVTWVNNGQTGHTVTADDGSFDSHTFQPGAQYTHTFTTPGRYPYYCVLHGAAGGYGMAGVIIVDGPSGISNSTTSSTSSKSQLRAPAATLRVPEDYPTIQAAVKPITAMCSTHPCNLSASQSGENRAAVEEEGVTAASAVIYVPPLRGTAGD